MRNNRNLSGAPDTTPESDVNVAETATQPVWDSDNRLVDPELDAHFKVKSEEALAEPTLAIKNASETALTAQKGQATEAMTADVMTSPAPSSDPNQRPSMLGGGEAIEPEVEGLTTEQLIEGMTVHTGHAIEAGGGENKTIATDIPSDAETPLLGSDIDTEI